MKPTNNNTTGSKKIKRLLKTKPSTPPDDVTQLLNNHNEALVIYSDPEGTNANIAVFTKMDANGILESCLRAILQQLFDIKNGKKSHSGAYKTTDGP